MADAVTGAGVEPVRKSITVQATPEQAFWVFTAGIDSWWPRSHHIGKVAMSKTIVEGRRGGRCYSEQIDGSECDWGQVLVWEPPSRLVLAWQIDAQWQYEPELAKSGEVEVRFAAEPGGRTRVDLEHRYLERLGANAAAVRAAIDAPNGWGGLLALFAERAASAASATSAVPAEPAEPARSAP
jgi:uncharacterized protein YndB with AHSA1/START domain